MNAETLQMGWWGLLLFALLVQLIMLPLEVFWLRHRALGAFVAAIYFSMVPLTFILDYPVLASVLMAAPLLYLMANALRWSLGRFNEHYQRHSVLRSAVWLTLVALLLSIYVDYLDHRIWQDTIATVLLLNLAVSLYVLYRATWVDRHYYTGIIKPSYRLAKLPAVTLAIPARNETDTLEDNLKGAISSDYPKLEILVLDDCSQDRTARVIRSFAHQGVRFVKGEAPAEGWLGKNKACELLAKEASGDIIIFAGVDTHLGPVTVSQLVTYMARTKADMISVLPRRRRLDFLPIFLQPLRDFWQVMIPLRTGQVPVASQCWMIKSEVLKQCGGFAGVRGSVFPEEQFAKTLFRKGRYRFVMADRRTDLTTRKRLSSQIETSTRTYYPLMKRRPIRVTLISTAIGLLLAPYAYLIWQAIYAFNLYDLQAVAVVSVLCLTIGYLIVMQRTNSKGWWLGIINLPFALLFDLALYNWSMLAFEFGEVNWKGRNVCYPVIEAIPQSEFSKLIP
ncbi:MAG TPA: glycosyltransferase [Candidatus Saccharimonadales bacterium]|nr:glycosyltransferase [Candidatus Saccharimonadales bacterium]